MCKEKVCERHFATLTDALEAKWSHDHVGWSEESVSEMTRAQARKLGEFGWPEGVMRANKLAATVADRVMDTHDVMSPHLDQDSCGAAFDVGAIVAGVPEAWIRPTVQPEKREVRIIVNGSVSAGIGEDIIMARGVAVCALALSLLGAGFAVTIDAVWAVSDSGIFDDKGESDNKPVSEIWTRLHDAGSGAPLDIDRVVYALAHPTFSRYTMIDLSNDCKAVYNTHCSGMPCDIEPPEKAIYLKSMKLWRDDWKNPEGWVKEQFEAQTKGGN